MDNTPIVDFTLVNTTKKKQLFWKRPKGTPVPVGYFWKCICGCINAFKSVDHHCSDCGTKLRLQENAEEKSDYFTNVIVQHSNVNHR